jgi:methylmalonyl-CoA mutase N-terminal domain/subunit
MLALGASALSLIPCNSVFRGYDMDEVPAELLGTCGTVINHVGDMDRALDGVPIGDLSTAHERPYAVHAARLRCWRWPSGAACPGAHHRHLEPERLPLALRRQPHVLPASRCRARGACWSTTSLCQRAGAALEPAVHRRPAHAAGGRHAGRGDGLHAVLGDPVRRRLHRCGHGPRRASCRASRSSSTSRSACSRKSPSSAPAVASGPSCARERFGAKDPRSWRFKFHGQTSGVDLTRQQPLNNIARVTTQAMAGIFGGLQSLHTDGYDEVAVVPDDSSARASPWRRRTSCARKRTSPT